MSGIPRFMIPSWLSFGLAKVRWRIVCEVVLLCLLACTPVVSAKLSQYAIDEVIGQRSMESLWRLLLFCGVFVVVVLALKYATAWISATARQRFALYVRDCLWKRWIECIGGDSTFKAGEVSNRLQGDVYTTGDVAIATISTVFVCLGSLIVYLTMLFRCNGVLAWIALSFIPCYLVLYVVFGERLQRSTGAMRSAIDHVMNFVVHRWERLDEIRILQGTATERKNFAALFQKQFGIGLHLLFLKNFASGVADVMMTGWNLVLFAMGAYLVLQNAITLGELIAVQMIAGQIMGPIQRLLNMNLSLKMAQVSISRISEIDNHCNLFNGTLIASVDSSSEDFRFGRLELQDVVLHSRTADSDANVSVNLDIPLGGRVGLEGANGTGKTSVCRILVGLRAPVAGTLFLNGHVVLGDRARQMCEHVLLLTQTPFFFAGTLRENLAYGLPESVDDLSLRTALEHVGLGDWLEALADGLDFRLADDGANLSNGQRQRLHCARALLRQHEVVVVDEALSGLEEADALRVMEALGRNRTLVVTRVSPSLHLVVTAL